MRANRTTATIPNDPDNPVERRDIPRPQDKPQPKR